LLALSERLQPAQRFYLYEHLLRRPTRFTFQGDSLWLIDEGLQELLQLTLRTAVTGLDHALLGEEYLALNLFVPALQELDTALRLGQQHAEIYLLRGRALYGLGRYAEALTAFDRADRPLHDFWRGNALFRLGRYEDALQAFQAALELEPDNDLFLFNSAQALLTLGRFSPAEAVFRRLLARVPDHPQARMGLARALLGTGEHNSAIAILTELTKDSRAERAARHYLGLAYLQSGDLKAALPLLERSAREGPFFKEAFSALALAYRRSDQPERALYFEQRLKTFDRQAQSLRGYILENNP
jgi:tetratricopeptide (TPR) repeat protein